MNPYLFAAILLSLFAASAYTEPPREEETPPDALVLDDVRVGVDPDSLAQLQTLADSE